MHRKSTHSLLYKVTSEVANIREMRLRVRWENVAAFMRSYATYFWPVDRPDANSGRKLLHIWLRDLGDDHNVVFVYEYDQQATSAYYERYANAFVEYHTGAGTENVHVDSHDPWPEIDRLEEALFAYVEGDVASLHFAVDLDSLTEWAASDEASEPAYTSQ